MRRLSLTFVVILLAVSAAAAQTPWVVYYASTAPVETFAEYRLLVFDSDDHPPLAPLAKQGKTLLGYLSVGEVERNRAYFSTVRAEGLLLQENQNWPGSYFVDVRQARWKRRVLDELIPRILGQGFAGVFLDTLDNPPHLERTDPQKYRGMTAAATDLVTSIRRRYPAIRIMMNRGYELLPAVERDIDYVLGESVFTDYDFQTKKYGQVPRELYQEQVRLLTAARSRRPALQVFTLDYWYPTDAAGVARIYAEQRRNGFSPYVATIELDRVVKGPR
jgi:uncharacterized protein (TIGR01370 family)